MFGFLFGEFAVAFACLFWWLLFWVCVCYVGLVVLICYYLMLACDCLRLGLLGWFIGLRLIAFCYLQLLDLLRALLGSSGFSDDLRLRFVL